MNVNLEISEFCPKCQRVQNLKGSISKRQEITTDNETKNIVTMNYHCEKCFSFVRSDEFDEEY